MIVGDDGFEFIDDRTNGFHGWLHLLRTTVGGLFRIGNAVSAVSTFFVQVFQGRNLFVERLDQST